MAVFINILIAIAVFGILGAVTALLLAAVSVGDKYAKPCENIVEASEKSVQKTPAKAVAFIKCAGNESQLKYTYVDANDCFAASLLAGGMKECEHACLGLGTCAGVCKYGAITVNGGVYEVDEEKCTGCGECVKVCPRALIELMPESARIKVRCSSVCFASQTRKICDVGCIGCLECVKTCDCGAIEVKESLAVINYEKCTSCGRCAEVCPRGIITQPPVSEKELEKSECFEIVAEKEVTEGKVTIEE